MPKHLSSGSKKKHGVSERSVVNDKELFADATQELLEAKIDSYRGYSKQWL